MSWQKCMSFSKCSNLEAKNETSNFAIKEIRGRTIISHKQNLENKGRFYMMGFMHLKIKIEEKFKLKTKLTKTKI